MDLLKQVFAMDAAHYPETLGALYIIQAPSLFPFVYKMLAPFVDARE